MSTVQDLYTSYNIDHWFDLEPSDQQYVNFDPSIVYAAHKIGDVYSAFSNARSYLSDSNCENFGQLISQHDELHKNYLKTKFLQSALSFYNYAIDLSWQVLWFYLGDNSYLFMEKQQYYNKFSEQCTYPTLLEMINVRRMPHLRQHLINFQTLELTEEVRKLYNYVKHRGSLYTTNLGEQYPEMLIGLQIQDGENTLDYVPSMITRIEFNLVEWEQKLIEFDKSFFSYFEQIIEWVLPNNFKDVEIDLFQQSEYTHRRLEFIRNDLNNYEEQFRQAYLTN